MKSQGLNCNEKLFILMDLSEFCTDMPNGVYDLG